MTVRIGATLFVLVPAEDTRILCPECGSPDCTYLWRAPECDICGVSRLDAADRHEAAAVYQVGKRALCLGCLRAEESGKRQRVAS